ncbi:MAG: hypothetical protein Q4P24_18305 [Rhodobacterales bacterium]|nr:hypothetical protein [Rhodobacterales bacterium]
MTYITDCIDLYQASNDMIFSASEVVSMRTTRMLTGQMSAPDALEMMTEKAVAVTTSFSAGFMVAIFTGSALETTREMLAPYESKVALNVVRLRNEQAGNS